MNEKNTSRSRMLVAGIQFSKNAVLGDKNRKETNSSQQKKGNTKIVWLLEALEIIYQNDTPRFYATASTPQDSARCEI